MKKVLLVLVLGMTMFSCSKEEIDNEICGGFTGSGSFSNGLYEARSYFITIQTDYGYAEVVVDYSVYIEYKDTIEYLKYICLPKELN